jgi:sigma-B regulation protein RsbU (phosphoserine phosphatase)
VTAFESNCKPLGFFSDEKVDVVRAVLSPGDTVVLYTDGVSEASNRDGEEYGVEALRRLVAEQQPPCCPSKLVQACKQRLAAFRGAEERTDDETLLAIQYAPETGQSAEAEAAGA